MKVRYKPKTEAIKARMKLYDVQTIVELSNMAMINRITTGKVVRGEINVSHYTATAISKALKCPRIDLFVSIGKW